MHDLFAKLFNWYDFDKLKNEVAMKVIKVMRGYTKEEIQKEIKEKTNKITAEAEKEKTTKWINETLKARQQSIDEKNKSQNELWQDKTKFRQQIYEATQTHENSKLLENTNSNTNDHSNTNDNTNDSLQQGNTQKPSNHPSNFIFK